MPINDDTAWITRDNLNVEGFSQIILNEDIWISKEYCQWKMRITMVARKAREFIFQLVRHNSILC